MIHMQNVSMVYLKGILLRAYWVENERSLVELLGMVHTVTKIADPRTRWHREAVCIRECTLHCIKLVGYGLRGTQVQGKTGWGAFKGCEGRRINMHPNMFLSYLDSIKVSGFLVCLTYNPFSWCFNLMICSALIWISVAWPPADPDGWWIMIRALGREWRIPSVPAAKRRDPIEHAWPTHHVAMGGSTY